MSLCAPLCAPIGAAGHCSATSGFVALRCSGSKRAARGGSSSGAPTRRLACTTQRRSHTVPNYSILCYSGESRPSVHALYCIALYTSNRDFVQTPRRRRRRRRQQYNAMQLCTNVLYISNRLLLPPPPLLRAHSFARAPLLSVCLSAGLPARLAAWPPVGLYVGALVSRMRSGYLPVSAAGQNLFARFGSAHSPTPDAIASEYLKFGGTAWERARPSPCSERLASLLIELLCILWR